MVVETSRPLLATALVHVRMAQLLAAALLFFSFSLGGDAAARGSPRVTQHYLQYGVGLVAETVASPGEVCPEGALAPCILDSGVGLAIRFGYRTRGPWYIGGAYEFSRQDSSNLLRLAILQQLRGEGRYYFLKDTRLVPYVAAAAGATVYGNEWGIDTGGFLAFLGGGFEFQVSRTSVVGATVGYRPLFLRRWEDSARVVRADGLLGFGVAHFVVGELVFEVRDPLPRW
jgi:hypothetical protein